MKSSMCIVLFAVVAALAISRANAMPPQCSPENLAEIDNPKIQKICEFLQNYAEAVELSSGGTRVFPSPLFDSGVKRQDVDHVFLRFGKRR